MPCPHLQPLMENTKNGPDMMASRYAADSTHSGLQFGQTISDIEHLMRTQPLVLLASALSVLRGLDVAADGVNTNAHHVALYATERVSDGCLHSDGLIAAEW